MGFFLFLLVNAVLFIRPAEIVAMLAVVPVYQIVIIGNLLVCLSPVMAQLSWRSLRERPTTLCVIGLLFAVMMSHLANGLDTWTARYWGIEFGKVVLYYLLLLAVVTTPARLRQFLRWLVAIILVVACLALLQFHGAIDIPGLEPLMQPDVNRATGEETSYPRIRSTGIFNDPNDLSLILGMSMLLCLYWLGDKQSAGTRWLWVIPLVVFGYTFALTKSRGGLLALLVGLLVLFRNRYGWWKTIPLAVVTVPAVLLIFGGRQTDIGTTEGTAQERILLWSEGLAAFRQRPLFGIGAANFQDEVGGGKVAHNSYVEAYTELGFLGGTLFIGAYYFALRTLYLLGSKRVHILDPEMRRLRPYLMALLAGYAAGMFSLSRNYIVPTYLTVALATAFLNVTPIFPPFPLLRIDSRFFVRLCGISVACLFAIYLFVRTFARYGIF